MKLKSISLHRSPRLGRRACAVPGVPGWCDRLHRIFAVRSKVLVVTAYRDFDSDLHGMNAWPASGRNLATYMRKLSMAKDIDPHEAGATREDARRRKAAGAIQPYPKSTLIRRPNQVSRMFNVRLPEEQFAAIQQIAESQRLPMSTMARAWSLDRLDKERSPS